MNCGSNNEEALAYEEALNLLSNTVAGAETWLWPTLIAALLDPTCSLSVTIQFYICI